MIIHRNKVLACYKEGGDWSRLSATQTNPQILENRVRDKEIKPAMALHGLLLQQLLLLGLTILAASEPNSICINSCGSLNIPYPFGTSEGCYLDESFLITCNNTFETPRPFLRRGNITVLNISLDGELRVSTFVAHDCYNESGLLFSDRLSELTLSKFPISYTKNKFTAVGCDT